jgi:hypothetical protein
LDIVQPCPNGERVLVKHVPGSITGEFSMITGQRCLLLGRVTEAGEFLQISADSMRSLVAKDAELSEIFHARVHSAAGGADCRKAPAT